MIIVVALHGIKLILSILGFLYYYITGFDTVYEFVPVKYSCSTLRNWGNKQ
jgi:hypothetical protein